MPGRRRPRDGLHPVQRAKSARVRVDFYSFLARALGCNLNRNNGHKVGPQGHASAVPFPAAAS